ncbi:MAG: SDR family NAD(P)-dependent oxidoreductase [Desulfobacteraceae bacterium]|nr:MAG: SDR family NAD(P)-dependent oxidoreductase [Desulfobacteraceae bacterium]
MKLSNNAVFITGGASGIGFALAKSFLELKNTVIICGRNSGKLQHVKERFPEIHVIRCDVTNEDDLKQAFEFIKNEFGILNILVNNAGIQYRFDFREDQDAIKKIDEEIDINFRAVVHLTKLFIPVLSKAPQAAIVNVSSGLGIVPKKSAPGYCATKAAIHAFSKSLRYQLEETSIKLIELFPPFTDTDMTRGRDGDIRKESPDFVAKKFFSKLAKDRFEIKPGLMNIILLQINRFLPSLAERIAKKR